MTKITSMIELQDHIAYLETKQEMEVNLFKAQVAIAYESLKPVNFIKNTLKEFSTVPELKKELLESTLGMAAGYFSKSTLLGEPNSPLKKVMGTILQLVVTSLVSNNVGGVVSTLQQIYKKLFVKDENVN